MLELALPRAALGERADDVLPRGGVAGGEELVDAPSDRFLTGVAVKLLATAGPVQDPAVHVVDDDDPGVENA